MGDGTVSVEDSSFRSGGQRQPISGAGIGSTGGQGYYDYPKETVPYTPYSGGRGIPASASGSYTSSIQQQQQQQQQHQRYHHGSQQDTRDGSMVYSDYSRLNSAVPSIPSTTIAGNGNIQSSIRNPMVYNENPFVNERNRNDMG